MVQTETQLAFMKSENILFHFSVITAFRASTFGREVLLILSSKTHQTEKSRGFTLVKDEIHKSAGQKAAMFSLQKCFTVLEVFTGTWF
uniref:Uncharacterized protein n=1 Tax=Lepeophtheirus salmonis TaxID=72036 RepID=A0A0K2UHN9_LEPSM